MVKKFFSFLGREVNGLHEAAFLLGFFAIASQVLGLLRDRLLAGEFGAGTALDLYYAAFRVPDFLFVTIASLVSASVLIPFLNERWNKSPEEGKKFIDTVFSVFGVGMVAVCALAFFLMPFLIPFLFPGFGAESLQKELVLFSRVLLLSPLLLGLSSFFGSITQLHSRFFLYALSPVLYNLGIILGVVFLSPLYGILGVVIGVAGGAFLHLFIQIPFIVSHGFFPRFIWPQFGAVRDVVFTSLPRTIALSSHELAEFFLISFASLMAAGSISVFNLSFNLASVPLSVIGVSYSLAAFPTLTRYFSSGNMEKFIEHLSTSLRHVIFLSMPVVVAFIVLRAQIVRVILGSGEFSWSDTRLTAAALALFVLSLIPQSLMLIFTRARYSTGNTRSPLIINVSAAALTIILAVFLARIFAAFPGLGIWLENLLRVESVSGAGVLVLPLSFSIGASVGALLHLISFGREFPTLLSPAVKTFWQTLFASLAMGVLIYFLLNVLDDVFALDTFAGIFMQGFISGLVGLALLIILLALMKSRELHDMWQALHKKFWKADVIGPDAKVM